MLTGTDTAWIVDRAKALSFDLCGVVLPEKFPELQRAEEWLAKGYAGEMKYLEDPRRSDPHAVFKGLRSIIVCALNYNTAQPFSTDAATQLGSNVPHGWISRYAWGDDYHEVLHGKLESLLTALREHFNQPFEARLYADTGPIQERIFAKYAGLGWLGKNTLLLNQQLGSFFFLGVILTSLELQPTEGLRQGPPPDRCGTCRQCIDACPTDALVEPYVMDARRCISYLTIELRESIPEDLREAMGRHVYGCDICQDVCPWNRESPATTLEAFQPRTFPATPTGKTALQRGSAEQSLSPANEESSSESSVMPRLEWLAAMSEEEFRQVFRGSAIKRTKWRGLVRNACIALGNSSVPRQTAVHNRILALLGRLRNSSDGAIAESAQWALLRIQ